MWAAISGIILRNRLALLISVGVVTLLMAYHAQHVQLSYEFASLLPKDDVTSIEYAKFRDLFGEDGNVLVIGIRDTTLYRFEKFCAWYDLTHRIREMEGVEEVVSLARIYTITKNEGARKFEFVPVVQRRPESQEEVDSIRQVILSLPFYDKVLHNRSTGATLMAVTLEEKKLNSKTRIDLVDRITEAADECSSGQRIAIHYSGLPYIRTAITAKVREELQLFLWLALLVTAVILFLFFRSLIPTLFSVLVVVVGVIWSMGTIVLLGYKITMLTGLIPPLIIVIGIPNCIFLLNKYHREYRNHGNQARALARVIQRTGNAILMTNLTTACGFATFIITESVILQEFGVLASVNIMLLFLLSLVLIPIIFSYLAPPAGRQTKHLENRNVKQFVEYLVTCVHHYRRTVYVFTLALVAVAAVGISRMRITGSIVDDLPRNDPVYMDLLFFEEHFSGVMPFEVYIDTKKKKGVMQLSTLGKIDKLQDIIESYPQCSRPLSVVDVVKFSKQAYYNGNESKYQLPTKPEQGFILSYAPKDSAGRNPLRSFLDSSRQITRVSAQMADIGTSEMKRIRDELRPRIDSLFDPEKYHVVLTGTSLVFLKGTNYLVNSLFISVALAVGLISLFMSLLFRSVRMVLISLVPNFIPLLVTAALMGFFDIPIKPSTVLVFSIAFGISVDDTIHFLAKYKQELRVYQGNIRKSVLAALREVGVSMMYTSIILFFGFGIFTVSKFGGTMALGMLIAVTLFVAMFSNLIVLPSLLMSLDKAMMTKVFREPLFEIYDEEEDIDLEELRVGGPAGNTDNTKT